MQEQVQLPTYHLVQHKPKDVKISIKVVLPTESNHVHEHVRSEFQSNGTATHHHNGDQHIYVTPKKASSTTITQDTFVEFSKGTSELSDYYGVASDVLVCHKFSRKSERKAPPKVYVDKHTVDADKVIHLAEAKNLNIEHSNSRGDVQGIPTYFEGIARKFATQHNIPITVIKGEDLLKEGFRLMHAVGRASKNTSVFVNLKYHGNPDSDKWVAFVGKGVCFDTGGYNIKPASGMKDMHLDKCGAISVLTAFQYIVKEKIKINLTATIGLVENFINQIAYRPSDIIKSRKGLTVEIGNTDAEGRLVLADCMHWTQQHYKTQVLIELSTLTGAIIGALGHHMSGLFSNDEGLANSLVQAGKQVHELSWCLPLDDYYRELPKHQLADLTNLSSRTQAGSIQAAAFLQNFVQKGTKWIHLDIAGTSIVSALGTGYGARLLLQYARNYK